MPQLDPTWFASQIFWIVVMFCIMYFAMAKFSLPPITKVLEERQNLIEGDIQKAMKLKEEAEEALKNYENALAGANAEARKIMAETKNEVLEMSALKEKEMDAALEIRLHESEKKLAEVRENALKDVQKMSEEIASAIVLKLTGSAPSKEDLENAVREVAKEAV